MHKTIKDNCVIVDLDFTLVNVNTTFDFLSMFFRRKYILFSRLLRPLTLLSNLLDSDVYKQLLLILCIKKRTREELERYSKAYFKYVLRHRDKRLNIMLLDLLKRVKCKKILLTSSIDVIAEPFKTLGFDFVISSKTYYKDGKFIRVKDLYGKKHKIIEALSKYFCSMLIIEDEPEPEYMGIEGVKVIKVLHK